MPTITDTGRANTVVVENRRTVATVVKVSTPMPVASPGPQGAPGVAGDQYDTRVAGVVLGGHRVVRSLPDGRIGYASALNAEHGDDTVGLAVQAAVVDATVNVQRAGSVTFSGWAWAPGEPVFLAADGALTQTLLTDVDGAAFMQVVGHAESPTALFVGIQPPIYY